MTPAADEVRARGTGRSEASFGSTDFLLLTMTIIWGSNFTAIKYSLEDLLPLSFNGLRFAIASVTLLIAALATGHDLKVPRADGWRLFGLGLLANAAYQTLFIMGMANTRTGNAALIVSTTPLFTAVLGRMRRQEHFTKGGVAGLILAFAGIVVIILSGRSAVEVGQTILGDCLLLGATLCWSLYTVGAKRFLHTYGSMKATTIMMIAGTPFFLILCAPSLIEQDWSRVRPAAWGGLLFSAFLAIALAHFIWNYGVRRLGSTRTAIYSNITPVTALIVAWLALGEAPTLGQVAGALIIFAGLYLVRHGMRAVAPAAEIEEEIEEASLGPGKN